MLNWAGIKADMAARITAFVAAHRPRRAALTSYILLLSCGVLWGMTFAIARIASSGAAKPLGLTFWQAAGGGLLLLIFCILRRGWYTSNLRLTRANFTHALVIALCGTAIPTTLYYHAAPKLPAGVLAITVALVPMLTYGLAWLLRLDKLGWTRAAGILTGFAAIVLLMASDSSLPDPSATIYLVPALVAVVFYTVENVYVDARIPRYADMAGLLAAALFIAAVLLAPAVFYAGEFYPIRPPFDKVDFAILAMMAVSSTGYLLFLYVVKLAGAVFASLSGYIITLSGVFWGIAFFGERHSAWVWAALALMLVGMGLVRPRRG